MKRRSLILAALVLLLSFSAGKPAHADITTGLVGYYAFDAGSGTTVADSSSAGNALSFVGNPSWAGGKIGSGSLSFDGSGAYLTGSSPAPGSAMTVSAWIKPSSANGTIIYRGDDSCCLSYKLSLSGGIASFGISVSSGRNPDMSVNSGTAVNSGAWTLVTATYSGSALSIYINGVLDGTASGSGTIANGVGTTNIGALNQASAYFGGSLDDVRIYTRALSASDISELYAYTGGSSGSGGGTVTPPVTPPASDTTAPGISSVASGSLTSSSATISWTTDESSDSQIEYGLITGYGNSTSLNSSLATFHSVSLSSLTASTLYHYRVKSKDASGNLATGGDNTFTTSSVVTPPVSSGTGNYYIDYASGSDSNDGLTTATPWKHSPGDANATGKAAAATVKAGENVLFKGGVPYYGHITVGTSGSASGGYVTYATASGWGSSQAIIDGTGYDSGYNMSLDNGILIDGKSYIKVQNLIVQNFTANHSLSGLWWGGGGISISSSSFIEVSGCLIQKMDDYLTNPNGPNGGGLGVSTNSSNIKIFNNEFTKLGHNAIYVGESSNVEIYGNNIHNYVVWGMDIVANQGPLSNISIHDNSIHDLIDYEGYQPHTDYIIVRDHQDASAVKGMSNVVIEKNSFYNASPTALGGGATAFIYMTDRTSNVTLRNNTFANSHAYSDVEVGWYASNVSVLNNTMTGTLSLEGTNITAKNNILLAFTINKDHSALNTFALDNNLFVTGLYTDHVVAAFLSGGSLADSYPLAQWKTYGSGTYDQHSLYTTDAKYAASANGTDLHLSSNSPAINAGAALGGFSTDKEGISRPQGSAWDIGAYEYSGSSPITPPVTPPADTTAPSVSVTSPSAGTISGSVSLAASASDDTGVVGVQFKLDGVSLGTELTAAPYSGTWNTSGVSNGSHTLTAVARDAAGNTKTSNSVTVTVSNSTADTSAPSTPTGITSSSLTQTRVTLSWLASVDNVGVSGYKLFRNGTLIASPLTNTYAVTGLTANTLYTFTVSAYDAAGNTSSLSLPLSITTAANPVVTYAVSVSKSGTGSGTISGAGISCGSTCSASVTSGTSITLTATPNSDSTFDGWSGACTNSSGTCTTTVTAAKSVSAIFSLIPVSTPVTPPASGGSSGSGEGGSGSSSGGGGGGGSSSGSSSSGSVISSPTGTFTPTVPQAPVTSIPLKGTGIILTKNLYRGITDLEVTTLQKYLIAQGYLGGTATGYFGPLTEAGVMKYQAAHNITQTGTIGPITRASLAGGSTIVPVTTTTSGSIPAFTRSLTIGSTGTDVKYLQIFLNKHGFQVSLSGAGSPNNETTYFGPATARAVGKYQASLGIASPGVTGYGNVGPKTRAALNAGR